MCDQTCYNSVGSYACGCDSGYRLDRNGLTCKGITLLRLLGIAFDLIHIDINECHEQTDDCEEHCYNSIGSYYCNCTGPGYQLHSDGNTCESEYTK